MEHAAIGGHEIQLEWLLWVITAKLGYYDSSMKVLRLDW